MFHAFIHKPHLNQMYYVRRSLTPSQQRWTVEVAHTGRTIRQLELRDMYIAELQQTDRKS